MIRSFEELRQIGQNEDFPLDGDYVLADDINASTVGDQDSVERFRPIGRDGEPFTGRFDGKGHTISGLTLSLRTSDTGRLGLFETLDGATIQNLQLREVAIQKSMNDSPVGMLAGLNRSGEIRNVEVNGRIDTADIAGGVVGENEGGVVENVQANGTIRSATINVTETTGGLVGRNGENGRVRASESSVNLVGASSGGLVGWNSGTVSGSVASGDVAGKGLLGGLVGVNWGLVEDSKATGDVIATGRKNGVTDNRGSGSGGLVAENFGTVRGSSARGDVELRGGAAFVGGLVGIHAKGGSILRGSSSGSVKVKEGEQFAHAGGLVGRIFRGEVVASKATGTITAANREPVVAAGGLVGVVGVPSDSTFTSVISKSYATGEVKGMPVSSGGGLVGTMLSGSVRRSFAAVKVSGDVENGGGLADTNRADSSSILFWDVERSGRDQAVGDGKKAQATGLTTAEMQGESARENMQGLDFEETWQVVTGDYPALSWEDV